MTKTVKTGDTIMLHYTGKYKNGKVFDSTRKGNPIPVEVGAGEIIKGLENAVIGMQPGENKTVVVRPEEGFGNYDEKRLIEMPKKSFPENFSLEKGMELQLVNKQGKAFNVVVAEILDKSIMLDANHPLAGKVLMFDIELVKIV
jgi:peptidylprolyl isomerase